MRRLPSGPAGPIAPEEEALRLVARITLSAGRREALHKILAAGVRWDQLITRSRDAGVLPLLAHHIRSDGRLRAVVPLRVLARLEESRLQTVARNLVLFRVLEEVLDAFSSGGVQAILLKGAFLIPEVYRRFDLRTASDLDLLIRKDDLVRMDAALQGLGFVAHRDVRRILGPESDPSIATAFYHRPGEKGYSLDIRWHLVEIPACQSLGLFPIDMKKIWAESETWEYEGRRARCLSPRHHLLYLALHGLKHAFDPILFLTDVAEFWEWAQTRGMGVGALREEAAAFGLVKPLDLAFSLSRRLVGAEIPAGILDGLVSPRNSPWERSFVRSVLRARQARGAAYLIYLALLEGIRPKLSLVGRTFFAPPEAIFGANEATIEKMGIVPRVLRALKGVSMTLDVARGVRRKIPAP